ncbi:putative peptidase domain-containing protein [Ordospora pajunii]|uniref:putative peptidase domain-containing protein n=1 Tax=Ordospora pajunii TaxID=3039483 RepID=UPI0029527F0D|nr:putative peptidase domain-containing protein [Ordospora pajunii]KAH9410803.1 putative peptidase domain-containing protein [Ordospora pajunii]
MEIEDKCKVVLRVYPLGDSELNKFIASSLGKQEVHIWHTSVEVFGSEYYFQSGIMKAVPGSTVHGIPVAMHDLGVTSIPEIVFDDFLCSIQDDFAPHKYHLLRNNCNDFSNILAMYLVEKSIPDYILELQRAALKSEWMSSAVDMFFGK